MKTWPPIAPRRARHRRVPAFSPAPLRSRADGWTPLRQAAFLGALAETGLVCAAARKVGMARETAYRLRRRRGAESFAAAWDAVLGRSPASRRKVTPEERARRAVHGLLKVLIYRGKHVATVRKYDNSALVAQLGQLSRGGRSSGGATARSQRFTSAAASTGQAYRQASR